MNCDQVKRLLGALEDKELSASDDMMVRSHLTTCAKCQSELTALQALRETVAKQAPYGVSDGLRNRISRALTMEPEPRKRSFGWGYGFILGLACSAVAFFFFGRQGQDPSVLEGDILASHIRSLMPGHMTDVVSSDRHTVKPWFSGKVDISPPTWDFKENGFKLTGGRLDYIDGRATPVLVYRVRQHWINLFVLARQGKTPPVSLDRQGFHIVEWAQSGLEFVAVSDVDAAALKQFVDLYRNASGPGDNH